MGDSDLFSSLRPLTGPVQSNSSRSDQNPASTPQFFFNFTQSDPQSTNVPFDSQPGVMTKTHSNRPSHSSEVASPHLTAPNVQAELPPNQAASDRTANLLNLLRFNSQTEPASPNNKPISSGLRSGHAPPSRNVNARGVSASDLVASSMGKPSSLDNQAQAAPSSVPAPKSSSASPQDYLLQLLNRTQPAPAKTHAPQPVAPSAYPDVDTLSRNLANASIKKESVGSKDNEGIKRGRTESPIRIFGTSESKEPTPFEPPKIEKADNSLFTYVNPFEQLAASSPRNGKMGSSARAAPGKDSTPLSRLGSSGPNVACGSKHGSQAPNFPSSDMREGSSLTASGNEVLQSIESPDPKPLDDGRSQVEALIGIGAPTTDTQTVAQALNDVGEQVNRQVEYALAHSPKSDGRASKAEDKVEKKLEQQLQEAAVEVKKEIESEDGKGVLESVMPEPAAEAVKEVIDEAAVGDIEGQHESADDEDSSGKGEEDIEVPVYQFPLRPFVCIDLQQQQPSGLSFRQGAITDIARLRKDFDQIDRTLATASADYIAYAMPKPGGYRVICQEDGLDRQVFKETRDHIFNLAISSSLPGKSAQGLESCIGTAVSGTVYWAAMRLLDEDFVQTGEIHQQCLTIPPVPAHDEHTSGGQLKTRAKKSNRHPEFFAIGRGKSLQVIFPLHAKSSPFVNDKSVLDTEKYFKDRSLKINTGKAGKDFAFSEDDTVVMSLDKAGKLRFWDVRELVDDSKGGPSGFDPVEITKPILTFSTAHPNEKSWPTSVLFVDKQKAYLKGSALRYVIVGLKQNHTIQLWDLGLGKAVQELNFPHENESDPICSVAYHAASGIVVVGHPTRNSIYFVHLSAPKYNLGAFSQAKHIQKLANKDSSLPKPESTAILGGMREYSFASKGQLRSIDLLPMTHDGSSNQDDPGLFELYVMHSKGVTCLNVRKADLGWSEDNKVLHSRNAEEAGYVVVKDLWDTQSFAFSEPPSINGDIDPTASSKGFSKSSAKKAAEAAKPSEAEARRAFDASETLSLQNGGSGANQEKETKRKKKKAGNVTEDSSIIPPPVPNPPSSFANTSSKATPGSSQNKEPSRSSSRKHVLDSSTIEPNSDHKAKRNMANMEFSSLGLSPDALDKEFRKMEATISAEVSIVFGKELDQLYRTIDNDKRVQEAAAGAKQDAILRLVSSSLSDNVEKNLARIILSNITQTVVPSIHNVTTTTLRKEVPEWLSKHLLGSLPAQLKLALPEAVSKSLQNPDVLRSIADQTASKISVQIEKQIISALQKNVIPSFEAMVVEAAHKKIVETEQRINDQIERTSAQHREDSAKIDQLTSVVRALSETVHSMAESQSGFQTEILKYQQQVAQKGAESASVVSGGAQDDSTAGEEGIDPVMQVIGQELDMIQRAMSQGNLEEGTIYVSDRILATMQAYLTRRSGSNQSTRANFSTASLFAAIRNTFRPAPLWSCCPLRPP